MYSLSSDTLDLVKSNEGFSAVPYKDDYALTPRVEYSIGYGHQIQPGENLTHVTREEAETILKNDLTPRLNYLNQVLPPHLTDRQIGAILDYTMSFGPATILTNSLIKLIRENAPIVAIKDKWLTSYITTNNGTVVNAHLKARRQKEVNDFFRDPYPPSPLTETRKIIATVFFCIFVILILYVSYLILKK